MDPIETPKPVPLARVLATELRALRPELAENAQLREGADRGDVGLVYQALRDEHRAPGGEAGAPGRLHAAPLAALCFSGGGIRSATFNLGVTQALARLGLLDRFDYLSSVSGGGYIAAWLRAWMCRDGTRNVVQTLADPTRARRFEKGAPGASVETPFDPLRPEPLPVEQLREYANYLTPKLGFLSPDTWTAAAIVARNLVLNWLVLVPFLAALVTVPQFGLVVVQAASPGADWALGALVLAFVVEFVASASTNVLRRGEAAAAYVPRAARRTAWTYVFRGVAPIFLAALLLSTAVAWMDLSFTRPGPVPPPPEHARQLWRLALLWCVAVPIAGWLVGEVERVRMARLLRKKKLGLPKVLDSGSRPPRASGGEDEERPLQMMAIELFALLLSGGVAAGVLVAVVEGWLFDLWQRPALFVVFAMPVLLGVYLLARALFVAFASLGASRPDRSPLISNDGDREWWARLSGWILLLAVVWLVGSALCILGGWLWDLAGREFLSIGLSALGGVTGVATALLAKSAGTGAAKGGASKTATWKDAALSVAAPAFCFCLAVLLAQGTTALGRLLTGNAALLWLPESLVRAAGAAIPVFSREALFGFSFVPLLLVGVASLLALAVNVNRFSLHGFYRNRLVRAYLGASRRDRRPSPFTGFDLLDNPRLHTLWQTGGPDAPEATRPLPVINAALNLVTSEEKLAWQQRKAESFSMTPFFCGSHRLGYRAAHEYGGPAGISVGTAIAISGAAANPSMGFHTSSVVSFLMTLFNARLGAWLGNPGPPGNARPPLAGAYRRSGPRWALMPIVRELFGQANAKSPYVNLSDGGHFENLGVYEMVLRRCRFILASDAGHDPEAGFEDLGNLIRKVRIDFGVPIEFEKRIRILPKPDARGGAEGRGACAALARIRYGRVDGGGDAADGVLVYLKPTLASGTAEPYDVYSYAVESKDFPHESTGDQWFSESQFESYRALGEFLVGELAARGAAPGAAAPAFDGLPAFRAAVEKYLVPLEDA